MLDNIFEIPFLGLFRCRLCDSSGVFVPHAALVVGQREHRG